MFDFFKKWRQRRAANKERNAAFQKVAAEVASGGGNLVEMALLLHIAQNSKESFARLIIQLASSNVFILNKDESRIGEAAVCELADGKPYVATFTSGERAERATAAPFDKVSEISALELIFGLDGNLGIVLNPDDDYLRLACAPDQLSKTQALLERCLECEAGKVYTVWQSDGFRAVKILKADEGGVHIRLYGNVWGERPAEVDLEALSLSGDDDGPKSIGHLPLTRRAFLAMGPRRVADGTVAESELEGYRMWEEAKGGYFG